MENRIFIAVGSLLQESEGKYKLYPAVLRNLYKIGHELKRAIYIIYKDKKQKDAITKYILLLANEQIEIRDILSVKDSQKLMKDFPSSQDTVLSPDGGGKDTPSSKQQSLQSVSHEGFVWDNIYASLKNPNRNATVHRDTNETQIKVIVNLDGSGKSELNTGLGFFDHMLEQVARHGQLDLTVQVNGDLHIDEHHTIEDTGLALGEAFKKALGNKIGIERYGFLLPMDDCLAQVGLDFGGRPWLVWDATFSRENIGDMPTEMFFHFFKSFSDAAACNLNIKAEGENEHHKIEAIFKAFAKSIKMAKTRTGSDTLPSTKGVL